MNVGDGVFSKKLKSAVSYSEEVKKAYRVEENVPSNGNPRYFLVKDIRVAGKKRKVRKYLGTDSPSPEDALLYGKMHAHEIELRAVRKKAEMSAELYLPENLDHSKIKALEEIRFLHGTVKRLMTSSELEAFEENLEISYVHGTTFIEGNTLTMREARDLLTRGVAPKGKSLREIYEVQNYRKVLLYRNSYKGKVTIDFVKKLHSIIMDNIDMESAGLFRRTDDIGIVGYGGLLCPASLIKEELDNAIQAFYSGLEEGSHPFELAVVFHHNFETIHPFADGNGRVGREILNHMLTSKKYPRILVLPRDRERYLEALKSGDEEKITEMVEIFYDLLMEQHHDILLRNLKGLLPES